MYVAHREQIARTLDIAGTLYTYIPWIGPHLQRIFPNIRYLMSEALNTTDWKWHILPQGL